MRKRKRKISVRISLMIIILCGIVSVLIYTTLQVRMPEDTHQEIIRINNEEFAVIVADTKEAHRRGLSDAKGLCMSCGMLFVFSAPGAHSFWMKDMLFDIDILWIRDGHVVHIEKNVSHKTPTKSYASPVPADRVLELSAGSVDHFGITDGATIDLDVH